MTATNSVLEQICQQLPAQWHAPIEELAAATLQTGNPMRLVLLGTFSVGKSSLLNMLIQEELLPAALEETTALPTFIEHGEERSMQLVGRDGSTLPLEQADFMQAATQAPEGAACAVLNLPLPWLQGISIIDLPGLGSTSASHREYTLAHVQQGDAVLYLVGPCGPSQSDVELLKLAHEAGKRIKVLVTRWDVVEESVARGEKMPSLEQWAAQIQAATKLQMQLIPCHRQGLGRDEIIGFIMQARQDLADIRQRRFKAELKPILQNALGQNADNQRSCEEMSQEAARELHQEMLRRKQVLTEFKAGLYAEQQADRERVSQASATAVRDSRQQLARHLDLQMQHLTGEAGWETFEQQGGTALRSATTQAAQAFSSLSASYGALSLPEAQVHELNLRLPPPETVAAEDFLDMGKFSQLQQALASQQAELVTAEQKMASLPEVDDGESQQALQELRQQRDTIAVQPLPRIVQESSSGPGAAIGRMVGEVADVALMFVNPAAMGTKIASVMGKGAKMANLAVNTAKVAKTAKTGIKTLQAVQMGTGRVPGIPQPVLNKLSGLEMLSAGYWGERIGTLLGGGPSTVEVVDPQAMEAQKAALADLEAHGHALRGKLVRNQQIADERQLTGWAMEHHRKEQARLQTELDRLKGQAQQKHREAQAGLERERESQLRRLAERAVAHWLRSFDQQTAAMSELMHAHVKSHWENRVDALIDERLAEIDQFNAQAQAGVDEKRALLTQLRQDAQAIEGTLAALA